MCSWGIHKDEHFLFGLELQGTAAEYGSGNQLEWILDSDDHVVSVYQTGAGCSDNQGVGRVILFDDHIIDLVFRLVLDSRTVRWIGRTPPRALSRGIGNGHVGKIQAPEVYGPDDEQQENRQGYRELDQTLARCSAGQDSAITFECEWHLHGALI
jgi:hypothetical protein